MNTKRIIYWGSFIVVLGLIIWGMVAAAQKASREEAFIPLPDQVLETDHSRGNPLAKVTIVEYSDFQCPACAFYFSLIERIVSENINDIRFVYRHFPLSQHANAVPAAMASEAAGKQGKFWEMYAKIFETQDEWKDSTDGKTIFNGYAKDLGLDMNKYVLDLESKEVKDKVDIDMKSGLKAGINSTPSFYINGKKIQNPADYEGFKKLIDEARASSK